MSCILVVGAGLSAAAACAVLKQKHTVVVYEQRSHLGGNCRDYKVNGTYIHQYGAHIYHNPNSELHEWLSRFTTWESYHHAVTAEIDGGIQVPFPYSQETEAVLGKTLTDQEIIDTFFRGYSEKMWGKSWDMLPDAIRNRVPKRQDRSDFFPGQIVVLPSKGYSWMFENMFDGCEVILGANEDAWVPYAREFTHVIYCGRMDRLLTPSGIRFGDGPNGAGGAWLDHVSMTFEWGIGNPIFPTGVTNYCHKETPAVRRVQHAQITGGNSKIYHLEFPSHATCREDPVPTYPAPRTPMTQSTLDFLNGLAKRFYPNLIPLGRVAQHIYIDMHQAAGAGRALGEMLF